MPAPPTSKGAGTGDGGNGRLRAVEERLTRIETKLDTELKYLATKGDIETIRSWALNGALWGMVAVAGLVIGALKLLG